MVMDLVSTKIFVAIIFGLWRFFFGMLPVKLDKCLRAWEDATSNSSTFVNEKRHQQVSCYVALTQSFGGGVLFATCFLHMMKELFLSVEEVKNKWGVFTEYPVSQIIISIGFFFIYFLEEFSHWMVNKGKQKKCVEEVACVITKNNRSYSGSAKTIRSSAKITPIKTVTTIEEWELNQKNKNLVELEHDENMIKEKTDKSKEFLNSPTKSQRSLQRTASGRSRHSIKEEIERANLSVIEEMKLCPEDEEILKDQEQMMRCILTICALSLHSLLEGLSIGIQKFKYEIWFLFIGVSIHSASILFCMGVELILAQTRIKYIVIQMAALALASPTGIMLGLLVTTEFSLQTSAMPLVAVVLEGLCAGTILYITFFEVLNREKERRVYRLRRGLCIVGGFTLMALLQYSESQCEKHEILTLLSLEELSALNKSMT